MPLVDSLMQLGALDTTLVVAGARQEWLQKCCDALEAAPRFSVANVSEDECQVTAKYRVPSVWGRLTVTLLPEGTDSTRINAKATVLPNLFTLIFAPQQRILTRFARAIGPVYLLGPGKRRQRMCGQSPWPAAATGR